MSNRHLNEPDFVPAFLLCLMDGFGWLVWLAGCSVSCGLVVFLVYGIGLDGWMETVAVSAVCESSDKVLADFM